MQHDRFGLVSPMFKWSFISRFSIFSVWSLFWICGIYCKFWCSYQENQSCNTEELIAEETWAVGMTAISVMSFKVTLGKLKWATRMAQYLHNNAELSSDVTVYPHGSSCWYFWWLSHVLMVSSRWLVLSSQTACVSRKTWEVCNLLFCVSSFSASCDFLQWDEQ